MALWLKLKGYVIALGALLAALAAAVLYGRSKGKAAEQVHTRAAQDVVPRRPGAIGGAAIR